MRTDSVAQTATLTSLAFFLSSGLTAVSGAPVNGLRTSLALSESNGVEPWVQPCGTLLAANLKKVPQRHSVHRVLKRVRTQIRVAQNHFRKEQKNVREFYGKVYKELNTQYSMDWLPEHNVSFWYRNEVRCLEKGRKAEKLLPKLHDALQRFAIAFYHLKAFNLKSDITADMKKRNRIIDGMHNEILRMLCEVETAIQNLGLPPPTLHKANIVTSSNWRREGDLTKLLIQDWGILQLYQTFLRDWTFAFRKATARGSGVCDPNEDKTSNKSENGGNAARARSNAGVKRRQTVIRTRMQAIAVNKNGSPAVRTIKARKRLNKNRRKKVE